MSQSQGRSWGVELLVRTTRGEPAKTYKTTVRKPQIKKMKTEQFQTFMDECLKEGTDQGWVLHQFHQQDYGLMGLWNTFIWETND